MGEWSDHFEDFPDENPGNYVNGRFDPKGAELLRKQHSVINEKQAALNKEIADIVRKHRQSKMAE